MNNNQKNFNKGVVIININSTTVAVETSEELKEILEGNNEIDLIYFAKDITLSRGISILTPNRHQLDLLQLQ